jgi:hypothetical protein
MDLYACHVQLVHPTTQGLLLVLPVRKDIMQTHLDLFAHHVLKEASRIQLDLLRVICVQQDLSPTPLEELSVSNVLLVISLPTKEHLHVLHVQLDQSLQLELLIVLFALLGHIQI